MDTTRNRIPYMILSPEEKSLFCEEAVKRGLYETFDIGEQRWIDMFTDWGVFCDMGIYRLKILPDEWYYLEGYKAKGVYQGKDLFELSPLSPEICRPARQDEIPKPKYREPTDKDARERPECEFSNKADFPKDETCERTLIAVLSGGEGFEDRKFVCAYSWRTPYHFKYCRINEGKS